MKNNKKFLLLLLLAAPLLMANAPAPNASPKEYEDATISFSEKKGSNDNFDFYDVTLTNNGTGYIDPNDFYIEDFSRDYDYQHELIQPGKSMTLGFMCDKGDDVSSPKFHCYAFTEFEEEAIYTIAVKEGKKFEKTFTGYEDENLVLNFTYTYTINISYTKNVETDYYESLIFCVNFNGEDHYYYDYGISSYLSFQSDQNLAVDDITLKPENTLFIRGRKYNSGSNLGFTDILGIILFFCFVIPVIPAFVVAVVFLSIGIVKKHKNKKDNKGTKK